MEKALSRKEQKLVLRGLRIATLQIFQRALKQFFKHLDYMDYSELTKEQIEGDFYHLITKYKISETYQKTMINAVQSYWNTRWECHENITK